MDASDVVTVYAQRLADPQKVLAAASALGTGETFCATAADDDEPEDGVAAYSATISDTVATFVIDVTQDPMFGELPGALAQSGWSATSLTAYQISVASLGPGSDRLRYRLARALLEVTGGVLVGADGTRLVVESLADATWGSLW
ncbi:hypothetical protein KGA66_18800 [Actinocrinis puniceicyclus]|uniref:Uncharacterized protein n=1 Tax=Actinocrinis puniceicyclus TaxID=977794 RepID=A0A8J7WS10_9ACTN|nr:hypothetical protein [Actinocrinis puniceicyclus]MBS2965114.1 hypothetical protein [Actinocrinis puniceicyclus]